MTGLKLINEFDNRLFKRKELNFSMNSNVVPSKSEVASEIAKKYSVGEENIVVDKIKGNFGSRTFNISILIYDTKEDKEATELKKRPKKK